jgi:hypothetical protein
MKASLNNILGHLLFAQRRRLNVAVGACLVAVEANVHLKCVAWLAQKFVDSGTVSYGAPK